MRVEGTPSTPGSASFTQEGLAKRWGVSVRKIKSLTADGQIPCLYVGRRATYPLSAIEEYERCAAFSNCTDDVLNLLRRTRSDRGLAETIDDPALIQRVATIAQLGGDAA